MQGYFLTVTGDWVGCSSLEIFEKNPELQKGEGAFLHSLEVPINWLTGANQATDTC